MNKKISSALISVYNKEGLSPILKLLSQYDITIYATSGTQKFIENHGFKTISLEDLTGYPSILEGRVKTLHPKIFGGILANRNRKENQTTLSNYNIPAIDLVIVDLYPFEETLSLNALEEEIIEKIDVGGLSLIRAAAKNFNDTTIIASPEQYANFQRLMENGNGSISLEDRRRFATYAFHISSHYDTAIFQYFNTTLPDQTRFNYYKTSQRQVNILRYGENPHQRGIFYGDLNKCFQQLNGKLLSYNNLLDIDAALSLISEFSFEKEKTFAILKHNNPCGVATANSCEEAYKKALQTDPESAFGGIFISNSTINFSTAKLLHNKFFEILLAPDFDKESLALLRATKNKILLEYKKTELPHLQYKTLLSGIISQERDVYVETFNDFETVTKRKPDQKILDSMGFAIKLVKHIRSNAIVLAKDGQLFSSGMGQTSRVDSVKQAINKAKNFGFNLSEAVMASDGFFPFPDCVEIAHKEGIPAIVQPGRSKRDKDSIAYCDKNNLVMVMTGVRHFKH